MSIYRNSEYENFTLSDKNVIKYLILYRSKLDLLYNSNVNSINEAGDLFKVDQEIIVLYASLDSIIEQCNFNKKQLKLLDYIFQGNTIYDIYNMNVGYGKSATYEMLNKIINRIIMVNNNNWKLSMIKQGCLKE